MAVISVAVILPVLLTSTIGCVPTANRLRHNATKTQVIWLSVRSTLVTFQSYQSSSKSSNPPLTLVSVIGSHLSLSAYVATLCCRHALPIRILPHATITSDSPVTVNRSGQDIKLPRVSSRLDYCNSFLFGVTDVLLRKVQSVQNAAARLVTGAKRRDHITSVLQQLHWLSCASVVVWSDTDVSGC